jgi:hypothetical protein
MRDTLAGVITGLVFGFGLYLSSMTDPAVVQGFLDLTGDWNPTLIFVMAGGVMVTLIGYRIVLGQARPLWSESFRLPTATAIDAPLLLGAAIFGVGWGLAGYCPGPAIVSLASGRLPVIIFVLAMLAGTMAVRWMRSHPFAGMAQRKL